MMKQDYYIYLHCRKSDNKVFYVGKGRKYRAGSRSGRNSRWVNTYKKHGLIVELVFENLTEDEAFELEIDTIKEMRYHFESTMCNMTDGGEGVSGYKWEDMSKHPSKGNIGRKQTPEEIEYRASKLRGRKRDAETVNKNVKAIMAAKAGSIAFTRMKRFLSNRCIFNAREFSKMPDIIREDFYVEPDLSNIKWSRKAIENSIAARKGKPAHNGDKTIYDFINVNTGEIVSCTRRDIAVFIDKEDLVNVLKQIGKVVRCTREAAYGWKLLKENNGTI